MSDFIYFLCQPGFEKALKAEVTRALKEFKFSFSQPGFVTFRASEKWSGEFPPLVFALDAGRALGKPQRTDWDALLQKLAELPAVTLLCPKPAEDDEYFGKLRDLRDRLQKKLPKTQILAAGDRVNLSTGTAPTALIWHDVDAPITETFGWSLGRPLPAFTPRIFTPKFPVGGIWPLDLERYPARSYLKTQEACERYKIPLKPGQIAVEIGSAPGGSVTWLLEQGLKVMGIDAGKMDPKVLANPDYRHLSASLFDLKHYQILDQLSRVDWLLIDIHAPPLVTLKAVQRFKDHLDAHKLFPRLQGALITIKLNRPDAYQDIAEYRRILIKILEKPAVMHVRQLSSNRKEISVVALRESQAQSPRGFERDPTPRPRARGPTQSQ